MIKLDVIKSDSVDHNFIVRGDEPFRVEFFVYEGKPQAHVYRGIEDDTSQEMTGCYDGELDPPDRNVGWIDTEHAKQERLTMVQWSDVEFRRWVKERHGSAFSMKANGDVVEYKTEDGIFAVEIFTGGAIMRYALLK